MKLKTLIEKRLSRYADEEPERFILENKDKIERFIENPNSVLLESLPMEYTARFYILKHYQLFWHKPSEESFRLVLDSLFYYYSSYIVFLSNLERKNETVIQIGLCSLFLGILTFFEKKEAHVMMAILIERIEYNLRNDKYPMIYYQETLLQESMVMYDRFYKQDNSIYWSKYIKNQLNPIYSELIENICTDDEILFNKLINNICDYHLSKSSSSSFIRNEFYYLEWQVFPTEIMVVLRYRFLNGKKIDFVSNDLVSRIVPFLSKDKFVLSENVEKFKNVLYDKYLPITLEYLKNFQFYFNID